MKPYSGLRCKSFRENRRGAAEVIGMIFFFIIAMAIVTFFYEVAGNYILMQQYDSQRAVESLNVELLVLPGGHLRIRVKNYGPIPAKLIRLWVIDRTLNNHIHYPKNLDQTLDIDIPPWDEVVMETNNSSQQPIYSEWIPLNEEHEYSIRLVTARGNIVEPRPFKAIPGEGVIDTTYPPWVSTSESEICRNSSETPVYEISSRHDRVRPYRGGKGYLSIKNTGDTAFFITSGSRVIFKSTETGRVYAGRITRWGIYTWDGRRWVKEDDGFIDATKDSKAVYPGEVMVLEFSKPQEAPGGKGDIPPGEYRVYLHLVGYDEMGKTYFQNIYYGIVSFQR